MQVHNQNNVQYKSVMDFRKINDVTEDGRYPLPVLKDLLMFPRQGNKMFSSLDLLIGNGKCQWHPNLGKLLPLLSQMGIMNGYICLLVLSHPNHFPLYT